MMARMAREDHDREDLLAEATALVLRCELRVAGFDDPVFAGFRADGCGSVYFHPDEAYHFNTAGALRRAYRDGLLFKAERGRLVSLHRQRGARQVALVRHELGGDETAEFLGELRRRLQSLRAALDGGEYRVERTVGDTEELIARLRSWLPAALAARVAERPHAK